MSVQINETIGCVKVGYGIESRNDISGVKTITESKQTSKNDVLGYSYVPSIGNEITYSTYNKNGVLTDSVVNSTNVSNIASTRASNVTYQSQLSSLGFYNGPMDGNLTSSMSILAIKNFQKTYSLSIYGTLDANTKNKLETAYNAMSKYSKSEGVANIVNTWNLDTIQRKNFILCWTFLKVGMSLTDAQAAGVMGNIKQESDFSSSNANNKKMGNDSIYDTDYVYNTDDDVAYGLIQWCDESRKEILLRASGSMGKDVSDINVQLATLNYEAGNTYNTAWINLRNTTSYVAATQVFKEQFEECDDSTLNNRINFAKIIYDNMEGI